MTLCIAGLVRRPAIKKDVFVLCSDRQLDQYDWGSTDTGVKITPLGYNWAAQLAGNWPAATELARFLKKDVKAKGCPMDRAEMVEQLHEGAERFSRSKLYNNQSTCELLITGFIEDEPLMVHMTLDPERVSVEPQQELCAIGEGCYAASILLKHRQFNRHMGLELACYSLYEAKRFSETVSSVGAATHLSVHGPCTDNEKAKVCAVYLNDQGVAFLETLRHKYSFKPLAKIEIPDEMFS